MKIDSQDSKSTQTSRDELRLRTYYLGTLFDISNDLFGTLDTESILQNFLLMTMGNFGVVEGFILIINLAFQRNRSLRIERLSQHRSCGIGKQRQGNFTA